MGDLSDAEIRLRLLEAMLSSPVAAGLGDAMIATDAIIAWVRGDATRAECEAAQKKAHAQAVSSP